MATSKFKIQQLVSPKTLKEALIVKGIKEVLRTYKSTLDLDNKKHTSALYTQVLNYCATRYSAGKFETVWDVKRAMNEVLHIEGATMLGEILNKNVKKLKKANFSYTYIRLKKEKKFKYVKGRKSHIGADMTRTVAVRSKYGNTPVMFYEIHGALSTVACSEINAIKMSYKYDTGCNYYEARPILLSTWLELPEWNQQSTVKVEMI